MKLKKAFTLVEVIVVIAVLMVLAAILFPTFARVKDAGKRTVSLSQLRQLHLVVMLYQADYGGGGTFGSIEAMGLPSYPLNFELVLKPYGHDERLRESPCGVHPNAQGILEDVWANTWCAQLSPIYGEGTPLWWDLNCNDHSVKIGNIYELRRGIAVLLSGTAKAKVGTGNVYHPAFYSPPQG